MRSLMICSLFFCSFVATQALTAEDLPTPATIYLVEGNPQANIFLIEYGLKDVSWSRDDRGQAVTSKPTADVDRVELGKLPGSERNYLRGVSAFNGRNWDNAVNSLAEAAAKSRYAYLRVDAHLKRAQALLKLKRYDEALADIKTIKTSFSAWVFVVDAMILEGEVHAAAGDLAKAKQAYQALRNQAKNFGGKFTAKAIAAGALGEARLLLSDNDAKSAVPLLRQALKSVSVSAAPEQHGLIAITLGEALQASNAGGEAQEVYMGLRYAPVGAASRSKAFFQLGEIELASGNKLAALDFFLIAAVIRGGDDSARAQAKRKALGLLREFGADESLDPEIQKEYRNYAAIL